MFTSTCREVLTLRVPFLGQLSVFRYSMPKGAAIDRRVVVDRSNPLEVVVHVALDGRDYELFLMPWSVLKGEGKATA